MIKYDKYIIVMKEIDKILEKEGEDAEEILAELVKEHPIEEMVQFTDINIQEKIKSNTLKVVKYNDLYQKELTTLDILADKLESLIGRRYDFYRFEFEKDLTKIEIERYYLPNDGYIKKMKQIIRRQNIKVRFFKMCYQAFDKQQWNMKLFWETIKF